ncbi:MAG: hypothetical protein WBX01_17840 [Nitrososphaeraceae archaeon]
MSLGQYPIPLEVYKTKTRFWGLTTGFLYEDSGKIWLITARHNTYYTNSHVDIYLANIDYKEILIEKMVLYFRERRKNKRKWDRLVLFQHEIMEHMRISRDFSLDIAAIEISVFLESNPLKKCNCSNHLKFRRTHLSNGVSLGTEFDIVGFPCDYNLHKTDPMYYHGKVVTNRSHDKCGRYLFEIDCAPPHGVSGSPVITSSASSDKKIVLCGVYLAHHKNEKRGLASYAHYIDEITKKGDRVYQEVMRKHV